MIERLQAKRNEEGFTLIELLIVIIVLGILAAIVVFAVGSTKKDSVQASCKTNVKAVELSAEAVNTKLGSYPQGFVDTVTPANTTNLINVNNNAALLASTTNGALLKAWPSSSDYVLQYQYLPSSSSYQINVFQKGSNQNATNGVVDLDLSTAGIQGNLGAGSTACEALS